MSLPPRSLLGRFPVFPGNFGVVDSCLSQVPGVGRCESGVFGGNVRVLFVPDQGRLC